MSDNPLQPLGDGQVEGVAGGYLYYAGANNSFFDRWEVIDDKGDVVSRHAYYDHAKSYADYLGINSQEITWEELQRLRETGSIQ